MLQNRIINCQQLSIFLFCAIPLFATDPQLNTCAHNWESAHVFFLASIKNHTTMTHRNVKRPKQAAQKNFKGNQFVTSSNIAKGRQTSVLKKNRTIERSPGYSFFLFTISQFLGVQKRFWFNYLLLTFFISMSKFKNTRVGYWRK